MKKLSLLIACMMLICPLCACTGSEQPPAQPAASPNDTDDIKPKAEPSSDDSVLVWNLGADPKTFDPGLNLSLIHI